MTREELNLSLTNQKPSEKTVEKIVELRRLGLEYGYSVLDLAPDSREKSLAITNLEQSVMWAVKSLVLPRQGDAAVTVLWCLLAVTALLVIMKGWVHKS